MFNKEAKKLANIDTIIGAETVVEGKITLHSSVRIDGKVYGEVECDGDVTIGESGYVETYIKARNIIIAGTVEGTVKATEKLHVFGTGKLNGSAIMSNLIIEDGGHFTGQSSMNRQSEETEEDSNDEIEATSA